MSDDGQHGASPGPPVPLRSFVLYDVQGLFGGQALWAAEGRKAVVQIIGRPPAGHSALWEKRYEVELTPAQWAEVERLAGAHSLSASKSRKRAGVPDEARPILVLTPRAGPVIKADKWANDRDANFDPIYDYLVSLCRASGEPVREGAFDWNWRPQGFEQPW